MIENPFDQYIRSITLNRSKINEWNCYPFMLRAVKALDQINFHPNVTFFVGENGSGKSTLLEAIASSFGFNPEGGTQNLNFATEETHSVLYQYLTLSKGMQRPKDGFFLRAESFYNVATKIDELDREKSPSSRIIDSYGGRSLHQQSHGESFMSLLLHRFSGRGLYILDEPEAALSPMRQMAMLSRLHDLVGDNSQFIIATHSPIILSYPYATIYNVDDDFKPIAYKDTEHYQITQQFLNNPEGMLKILLD